jgi:hypothetical protein
MLGSAIDCGIVQKCHATIELRSSTFSLYVYIGRKHLPSLINLLPDVYISHSINHTNLAATDTPAIIYA